MPYNMLFKCPRCADSEVLAEETDAPWGEPGPHWVGVCPCGARIEVRLTIQWVDPQEGIE